MHPSKKDLRLCICLLKISRIGPSHQSVPPSPEFFGARCQLGASVFLSAGASAACRPLPEAPSVRRVKAPERQSVYRLVHTSPYIYIYTYICVICIYIYLSIYMYAYMQLNTSTCNKRIKTRKQTMKCTSVHITSAYVVYLHIYAYVYPPTQALQHNPTTLPQQQIEPM